MAFMELVTAFQTEIGTYCDVLIDHRELAQNDSPPRFVFIPKSHEFKPNEDLTTPRDGLTKTLLSRYQSIELHCWGVDTDQCELMEAGAITALRKILLNNYRPSGSEWIPAPLWQHCGRVLVHNFKYVSAVRTTDLKYIPVSQETALVESVQFDTADAVEGDGILIAGEQEIFEGD